MAFGLSSNPLVSARGVPERSTAHGVEPVVSMPIAATREPARPPSPFKAPLTQDAMLSV